jgi:periplasmic divalent cation tolerance protein
MLSDRHPYDVPEFLVLPVIDGSEEYLKWVDTSVGPKAES